MESKELEGRLDEWVHDGLITSDQATAIRAKEAEAAARAAPEETTGVPVIVEILGYVGAAFALSAMLSLVPQLVFLGYWAIVGLPLLIAIACLVGGFLMARVQGGQARRLSQVLLAAGVLAAGATAGLAVFWAVATPVPGVRELGRPLVQAITGPTGAWMFRKAAELSFAIGGLVGAVIGGIIYLRRHTVLQHLAFGAGVAAAVVGGAALLPVTGVVGDLGWVILALGIVWGALSLTGYLPPEGASLTLACLGVIGGLQVVAIQVQNQFAPTPVAWPFAVGLVGALALIGASIPLRKGVMLGFGAAGVVMFMPQLVQAVFPTAIGAPIVLLIAGVLLIGMSVLTAIMLPRMHKHEEQPRGPAPSGPTPTGLGPHAGAGA